MATPTQRIPAGGPAEWASDSASTVVPSLAVRKAGWTVDQRPPARVQNWFQRNVWQLLDVLYETLLKDWRKGDAPAGTSTINAFGWHNGAYYCEAGGGIYRSVDCQHWDFVLSNPDAGVAHTITSNGSRMVIGATNSSWYSDDDGASWTQTAGGDTPADAVYTFYMPNADIWVGCDDTGSDGTNVSTDGINYDVTSPSKGVEFTDYSSAAENAAGSIVLVGSVFTTDTGANFAAQVDDTGHDGYFYSELLGNFIAWDNTGGDSELHTMSGTAGTWNTADYAVLSDITINAMFELRGVMFAAADSPTLGNLMLLSRDLGLTWEPATSLFALDDVNPVPPSNGTSRSGEFMAVNTEGAGAVGITTPPFAGTDFAAVLAP